MRGRGRGQVRYEKRMRGDTKVKFMTDGILLREIQSDFLLSRYSAIIIDEVTPRPPPPMHARVAARPYRLRDQSLHPHSQGAGAARHGRAKAGRPPPATLPAMPVGHVAVTAAPPGRVRGGRRTSGGSTRTSSSACSPASSPSAARAPSARRVGACCRR